MVAALRRNEIEAYGCDFEFKPGSEVLSLASESIIRKIEQDPYKLPFADGEFSAVVSDQVMEHVGNLDETMAETHRVLAKGGVAIHIFPSRYTPLEPHIGVPLATMIRNPVWLSFWNKLGLGRKAGKDDGSRSMTEQQLQYLNNNTHYRSHSEFDRIARRTFAEVGNLESNFLSYRFSASSAASAVLSSPPIAFAYRTLRDRIIFCKKN
ncbi:MAG: methyltransferase domain-containing protein [Pseudomonadota bacterium]